MDENINVGWMRGTLVYDNSLSPFSFGTFPVSPSLRLRVVSSVWCHSKPLHLLRSCEASLVEAPAMGVSKEGVESTLTSKLQPTHLVS